MLSKAQLIQTINDLPEKFSMDDLLDRIMLLYKIDIGLQQSQKGEVISEEDLDKKLPEWLV